MLDIQNVKFIFTSSDDERCNGTGPGPRKVVLNISDRKAKMRVLRYLLIDLYYIYIWTCVYHNWKYNICSQF